jgi:hypothetical protein
LQKKSLSQSIASANLRPGDLLGTCYFGIEGDIINLSTYGIPRFSLSHVAILAEHKDDLLIFESTTQCGIPCAIRGVHFNGSQAHYIDSRLESYRGKVWHYPLAIPLRSHERRQLSEYLVETIGRPYDVEGGVFAVGKLWSLIHSRIHPESLSTLFCSEWVAASLRQIERFDTLDASEWTPNFLCRECCRRGITRKPGRIK